MAARVDLGLHDPALAGRVATLLAAPAEMLLPERLLLYAMVRALAPRRCLEIGTHFGGSTAIVAAALDDLGSDARLVCIDPAPLVDPALWGSMAHRATLVRGRSPLSLAEACALAGGRFDFAFIDGDHTRAGAMRDIEGVLEVAEPGAHLLLHDSHYWEVAEAIEAVLRAQPDRLIDAGMLSTRGTPAIERPGGVAERWGGLRLLRVMAAPLGR